MKLILLAALAFAAPALAAPAEPPAEKKSEYVERVRTELDALGAKIDAMEAKAKVAGAEARAGMDRQLKDLKARRKAALREFSRLKRASGSAWADIRAGLEKGLADLRKELDKAEEK